MTKSLILSYFLTLILISGISQQKIPLQHVDFNEEFFVLDKNKVKPKVELNYYWFKAKEVHHSYGACEGKPLDGEYKSFYKSHQLRSKGEFNKGLKHGKWSYWDESGKIIKEENYKNGFLHGEVLELIEDSLVKTKYKSGVANHQDKKDIEKELEVVEMTETTEEEKTSFWKKIFSKKKSDKSKIEEEEEPIINEEK